MLACSLSQQALIQGHTAPFITAGQLPGDLAVLVTESTLRCQNVSYSCQPWRRACAVLGRSRPVAELRLSDLIVRDRLFRYAMEGRQCGDDFKDCCTGSRPKAAIVDVCSKAAFHRTEFFVPVIRPEKSGSISGRLLRSGRPIKTNAKEVGHSRLIVQSADVCDNNDLSKPDFEVSHRL